MSENETIDIQGADLVGEGSNSAGTYATQIYRLPWGGYAVYDRMIRLNDGGGTIDHFILFYETDDDLLDGIWDSWAGEAACRDAGIVR